MSAAEPYYDSDERGRPIVGDLVDVWKFRRLLGLLVTRDLTVRYKRSQLGAWWTLLNPILTSAVLWMVFSKIFKLSGTSEPYIVYLLAGVLVMTNFTQAVVAVGSSVVNSAAILKKVYVPPSIFAFSAAFAAGSNLMLGLVPLLILQLVTGAGIPWTAPLAVVPLLFTVLLITGLGLLVAAAAVRFYDVLDLVPVLLQLWTYITPTFYRVEIVPERYLWLVKSNPLFSLLNSFRDLIYRGHIPATWQLLVGLGSGGLSFLVGIYVFRRAWKRLVVMM